MSELWELTLKEASDGLTQGLFSAKELTESTLERIQDVEPKVQSFITLTSEQALVDAGKADERIASGNKTPLTGIPMQLKDLLCTRNVPTTCGSKMLEQFVPVYNATVVEDLNQAGAISLGKGNMDEFAMGSSCETSAFHPTYNPWDLKRVPGGSSGGAAASVASGQVPFAIGSDTGGSIRQPAALCGVVGMKPTYGLVSRYGLIAFASSLDQIGPLTRTVYDNAMVLDIIAGHDPMDATSVNRKSESISATLTGDIKGRKLGVPSEYFGNGIDEGVKNLVKDAIKILEREGAEIVEVSLPHTKYALSCYYIIAPSECSSNLARYDGVKYGHSFLGTDNMWQAMENSRGEGFGQEVKRRMMIGTYALSSGYYDAYYLKAQKVRTLIKQEFDEVFQQVDAIISPTSPTTAFEVGEKIGDPLSMYLSDILTIPANMAGLPGMSVPCGFVDDLPVGLQIIGPRFSESRIYNIGMAYERSTNWVTLKSAI
ncbi:MAG: Asp-tRNA(Asn)/Glu-tRNA(Gln) amidotransferase subunit GatA [SAR202 cluster bacterium]|nr:Asp-tRNA(Asn)/Glu-tRNA(Gln) amidotransferase subunit GatA [SAR202 cluster bacterium]